MAPELWSPSMALPRTIDIHFHSVSPACLWPLHPPRPRPVPVPPRQQPRRATLPGQVLHLHAASHLLIAHHRAGVPRPAGRSGSARLQTTGRAQAGLIAGAVAASAAAAGRLVDLQRERGAHEAGARAIPPGGAPGGAEAPLAAGKAGLGTLFAKGRERAQRRLGGRGKVPLQVLEEGALLAQLLPCYNVCLRLRRPGNGWWVGAGVEVLWVTIVLARWRAQREWVLQRRQRGSANENAGRRGGPSLGLC